MNARARGELVDGLMAAAPWLGLGTHQARCRQSDHVLDAVVAALVARAAALGHTSAPPMRLEVFAAREGWIALPKESLACVAPQGR